MGWRGRGANGQKSKGEGAKERESTYGRMFNLGTCKDVWEPRSEIRLPYYCEHGEEENLVYG
jgi:hypothetical protein